jgi:anaerobic magnesium-protoporphyrin IX monomethyl ester cyclase
MPEVFLVNPPDPRSMREFLVPMRIREHETLPPLGLAYIAAVLEKNGIDVDILDAWTLDLPIQKVLERVGEASPKVVGITCDATRVNVTKEIAKGVKELDKQIKVVIGGPFPTCYPQYFRENIDAVALGEGEYTMLELVRKLDHGFDDVMGISLFKNERLYATPRRPPIENLDELPFPARHLLPMDKYFTLLASKAPVTSMFTSRGCPFECAFCSVPYQWGRRYRMHSPRYVVSEIEHLAENYGIKEVDFKDSDFTLNPDRTDKFCHSMIERKVDVRWFCNSRVTGMTKARLEKMKRAGCSLLLFGVESGDPDTLEHIRKHITLKDAEDAFKNARDVGIATFAYFIIGFPGETKKSIQRTIDFARKLKPSYVAFSLATPYPKTELWDWVIERGLLEEDSINWDTFSFYDVNLPVEDLSATELKKIQTRAMKRFYVRGVPNLLTRGWRRPFFRKKVRIAVRGFLHTIGAGRN